MNPGNGDIKIGGGQIVLFAEVVDENGADLGIFHKTCEEAVDAWLGELASVGVPLPKL